MKQPMILALTEHSTVIWHHTVPVGQSFEDTLEPSYWQHVAARLRPGHEIKIAAEDRTFWGHLFVRDTGKLEAKVGVISKVSFDHVADNDSDDADTFVKWRSPSTLYGVFRKDDKECLHDGFATKEAALVWAASRAENLAA